jgi:hypothetical protein
MRSGEASVTRENRRQAGIHILHSRRGCFAAQENEIASVSRFRNLVPAAV